MRISDWSSDVCSSDLFRASLDYTRLKKTDNITRLSEAQLLEFEELFPDRVQRGPNLPGDPAGWAGPVTYLDTSRINAASARMDTLDMQLRYGLELANGAYLGFRETGRAGGRESGGQEG